MYNVREEERKKERKLKKAEGKNGLDSMKDKSWTEATEAPTDQPTVLYDVLLLYLLLLLLLCASYSSR